MKPATDATLMTPPWPARDHAGQEAQGQIRQGTDIQVDHVELLGARQGGGLAGEAEARIVDDDIGNETLPLEIDREFLHRVRHREVAGDRGDGDVGMRGEHALDAIELAFIAGDENETMALGGADLREGLADPSRSAGHQDQLARLCGCHAAGLTQSDGWGNPAHFGPRH